MRKALLLLLVLLIAVSFFSCKKEEVGEEVVLEGGTYEGFIDVNRSDWQVGKEGGTFVMSQFGSDPKTFNPIVAEETSTTNVMNRLTTGGIRRNQLNLEWEPALAESWEVSDDEKTITLKLQKGLKWSDGEPITSEDFVWPVENVYFAEGVEGSTKDGLTVAGEPTVWKVIDDLTYSITFPEVYAGMYNIASTAPLPVHIFKPLVESEGAAAVNSFWGVDTPVEEIVSCGPFVIKEYVPAQKIVFGQNPNHWEKDAKGKQLPYIEELVYLFVESQDTQLQKLLAGELDYHGIRGEDYPVVLEKKEELGLDLYNVGPAAGTNFITFNQNPKEGEEDAGLDAPSLEWFTNKDFRVAMAYLVDRQSIADNIFYGFATPQYSFIPSYSPYYWSDVESVAYPYNPEKAKELLDEIGYVDTDGDGIREDTNGNKISFALNTNAGNTQREAMGTMFAEEARKVGVEVVFKPEDFNAVVTKLVSTYDWEAILIGLTGSVDPVSGANVYPSNGSLHMIEPNQESPRRDWEKIVDEQWGVANNTTDEDQRKRGFEEIQKQWASEVPWVYTVNAAILHAYKSVWGNIKPQPVTYYQWDGILDRIYLK